MNKKIMALSQQDFDDILAEGHNILSSEATALKTELENEPDFDLDLGENFGTGMGISISNAAQKIKDMSVEQRTDFGNQVSTLAISSNPPDSEPGT